MSKTVKGILLAAGVLFLLVIGGCTLLLVGGGLAIDEAVTQHEEEKESKNKLLQDMFENAEIVESEDVFGGTDVIVKMSNTSEESFSYIQIDYEVYDSEGTKIGGSFSNITDISPGQDFQIKLDIYQSEAASYEITGISDSAF